MSLLAISGSCQLRDGGLPAERRRHLGRDELQRTDGRVVIGYGRVELRDQVGSDRQHLLFPERRDDLVRRAVERVKPAQRLVPADALRERPAQREALGGGVHIRAYLVQRGLPVLGREHEPGQPDPGDPRFLPGRQEGVGPGPLHLVGRLVVAVGRAVEQQVGSGPRRILGSRSAEDALPDPFREVAGRRLDGEPGGAYFLIRERVAQHVQPFAGQLALAADVGAEGRVLQLVSAAADADLHPAAAQRVDDGDILGQPDRVLQRQHGDRGGKPDPLGAGGGVSKERPWRRQSAATERRVMLRDPAHVETQLVGDDEQLLCVAVGGGRVTAALDMGEKSEPETWLVGHELMPFQMLAVASSESADLPGLPPAAPRTRSRTAAAPPSGTCAPRQATCWAGRMSTLSAPYSSRTAGSDRWMTVNGSDRADASAAKASPVVRSSESTSRAKPLPIRSYSVSPQGST